MKLLHIKAMQDAGYPYTKNDLTIEEWLDLAKVRSFLEPQTGCPFMRGSK